MFVRAAIIDGYCRSRCSEYDVERITASAHYWRVKSLMPSGYWICVRCGLPAMHGESEVNVDDFGCYFLCRGCGRRNQLKCIPGSDDDSSAFVQVQDLSR